MNALNRHSCRKWFFIIVLIACILPLALHAQHRPPVGRKFRVNSYQTGNQDDPSAAALRNGGFVICWQGQVQVDNCYDIFGKLYSSRWNEVGDDFRINTYTTNNQFNPVAAALDDTSFVVSWESDHPRYGIFAQRFSNDGRRLDTEFQVNTTTCSGLMNHSLTVLPNGNYIVCREKHVPGGLTDLFGQLLSADGRKIGIEFQFKNCHAYLTVLPLENGGFFLVCLRYAIEFYNWDIIGQRFLPNGEKDGEIVPIYADQDMYPDNPEGTVLPNGSLVVCWHSHTGSYKTYVMGQMFTSFGEKSGQVFTIASENMQSLLPNLDIACLSNDHFMIVWGRTDLSGTDSRIGGQFFDLNGKKIENPFTFTPSNPCGQDAPVVKPLSGDGFFMCWSDNCGGGNFSKIRGKFFSNDGRERGSELQFDFAYLNYYGDPIQLIHLKRDNFLICGIDGQNPFDVTAELLRESPCVHPLHEFLLCNPQNDETLNSTNVTFRWQQPSDLPVCYPQELHYQVVWDLRPDFSFPYAETEEVDMDTCITRNLEAGKTYFWKVLARNIAGDSLWSSDTNGFYIHHLASADNRKNDAEAPGRLILNPNFPNPFNSSTVIRYEVKARSRNRLRIYDIHGRIVLESIRGWENAGAHQYRWEGDDSSGRPLPSGLYVCLLQSESEDQPPASRSQKISLIR